MALEELFGENSVVKIIDFFIAHEDFDYTKEEIAEYTKMSGTTFYASWKRLEMAGIIKESENRGGGKRYTINKDNEVAKKLYDFAWELTKFVGKKMAAEEMGKRQYEKGYGDYTAMRKEIFNKKGLAEILEEMKSGGVSEEK